MDEAIPLAGLYVAETDRGFDRFFDEHRDRLYRALWLVARDRSVAEEVTQDAFLKVWERWNRVRGLEDPAGYLYRTGMNILRNRRRRAALGLRRLVHASPPADDAMAAVEARDLVVRALGTLTPRERAALVLVDLLDMTSEDAAKALGVRASTVRVLAARGRTALRDAIGDDDA
ncbi:MAG: RNA polymerase sigma factor [Actinomycetota bacterium]